MFFSTDQLFPSVVYSIAKYIIIPKSRGVAVQISMKKIMHENRSLAIF